MEETRMKKTLVLLFAALLVVAFTLPASAFDSQFGGYWRTRWFIQNQFSGDDLGTADVNRIDTRTRLYYTAVFSDDFKFVNRFEFNARYGDTEGGDIGTDGDTFRVKHSFADFRTGAVRWTVGLQGAVLARGFIFDDDFAGAIIRYQPGTTGDMLIPLMAAKVEAGPSQTPARGNNDDVNLFALYPFFPMGNMNFNPYLVYLHQNYSGTTDAKNDVYWLGLDWDIKLDPASLWLTGIYQGGEVDGTGVNSAAGAKADVGAYLFGLGFNVPLGGFGLHGEGWYVSGDNDATDDKEKAFSGAPGNSYYWSEIMGLGIFDNQASNGAPGNNLTNIYALDIGIDWKPSDIWAIKADVWYASLVEEDAAGEKSLGTELDLVATYTVIENMKLDLVGAYLFSGKATGDKDPYELGMRLSFSF